MTKLVLFLLAMPLAASIIQPGVTINETNCLPVYCDASGSFSGFDTDTFSVSELAQRYGQSGVSGAEVTIDVTGKTLGAQESGWIEFNYPPCDGVTEVGCNGVIGAGYGFASAWFDIGPVQGGPPGNAGPPRPYAGALIPFEVGVPFGIKATAKFGTGPLSGSGSAEMNFSFHIFDSQMRPLTIYDPPNGSQPLTTPEPRTWSLILFGVLAYKIMARLPFRIIGPDTKD